MGNAKAEPSVVRKVAFALGQLAFAALWVVNVFFLICWLNSKVDESGLVYYLDHGKREYLPLPPLEDSRGLFVVMAVFFILQVLVLGFWVFKEFAREKFGRSF